jgi:hypothetical protein
MTFHFIFKILQDASEMNVSLQSPFSKFQEHELSIANCDLESAYRRKTLKDHHVKITERDSFYGNIVLEIMA